MNPPFSTHTVEVLQKFATQADALAAKAAKWRDDLTEAKTEVAAEEEAFLSNFGKSEAATFAEAKNRVRNLQTVVEAIENAGGPEQARANYLSQNAVFSALEKAFNERADALNKLVPPARKKLGERKAALTETGMHFALVESDPSVCVLRDHVDALVSHIAVATYDARYSSARGIGHTPKSFDALLSGLVQPFPQVRAA